MSAGAVVGAIAAHTVITSTIRNQEREEPLENPLTDEERAQASSDFMAGFIKQAAWAFGSILALMAIIVGLVLIFG